MVLSGVGLVKDIPYTGPRGVDVVGAALSVVGMGGIVLGILVWQEGGDAGGAIILTGAIALGLLGYWLVRRARQGRPAVLGPGLFESKYFRLGVTQQMLQQIAQGGMMIVLPMHLQMVLEYSAMRQAYRCPALTEHVRGRAARRAGRPESHARPRSFSWVACSSRSGSRC